MARGQEEWPERSGTRWGQWEGPPGPGEPLIRRISSLQGPWAGMIQGQLGSQELEDSWPQWQAKPLSCTQDPSASVREDLRDPGGPTNTLCISPLPPPSQHPVNRMFSLTPLRAMRCQRTSNPAPSPFHKPPTQGGVSTGSLFLGQALTRTLLFHGTEGAWALQPDSLRGGNPGSVLCSCVVLGHLLNLSVSEFPHL